MKILLPALLFLFLGTCSASFPQDITPSTNLGVWLSGKPWMLQFDGTGFIVKSNETKADERVYFLAANSATNLLISVFLETSKGTIPPGECKRSLEEKAKRNASLSSTALQGVNYRESGDFQILEFTMTAINGKTINQRNVLGCGIKDGVFIDVHISKMLFQSTDQPVFDALLQSIHFVPKQVSTALAPTGNTMHLLEEGSRYFIAHRYREAIGPYSKAFEIEKRTPSLDRTMWRVLIDNLSMAYGITGNVPSSAEVLNYGVSKDPDYPLFYYNLACGTAEQGKVQETESYLKLAFERRANVISGESLPDPRGDDSFQKLLKQKEFRQFVDALYGSPR
jgi:hypothetical protein